MTDKLNLKILSVFRPSDRIEEYLKDNEKLPRLANGSLDFWELGKQLCTKDGGRLPTMKELAQLASYIYGQEIGEREDNYDVEVENHIEGLDPSEGAFDLWSSEPRGTDGAYDRYYNSEYTGWDNCGRCINRLRALCLGDE